MKHLMMTQINLMKDTLHASDTLEFLNIFLVDTPRL